MTCFKNRCLRPCNRNDFFVSTILKGEKGDTGPAGPAGQNGRGLQIDGVVSKIEDLPQSPRNGTAFLVGEDNPKTLYVYDETTKMWQSVGSLQGDKGDKGDPGEKGDKGDPGTPARNIINSTYLVSLRDPSFVIPDEGLEVASGGRLPIKSIHGRSTLKGVVNLNADDNTITFLEVGVYEIIVTINGYVKFTGQDYNVKTDFVSIGFREVDSNNVYIGANDYSPLQTPHNITMIGLLQVADNTIPYEIVNLQKKPLFIIGGEKAQTLTNSYFTTPILTMLIKKLY